MADSKCEETSESTTRVLLLDICIGKGKIIPCDGSRTEKPEDSNTHLVTMVPEREIINNASTEQTLKCPEEDSTHE